MFSNLKRKIAFLSLILLAAPALAGEVTAETKRSVIDSLFKEMRTQYVFPEKAAEVEKAVRARLEAREYDSITDGTAFASLLTEHMKAVLHDAHFGIRYSERPLAARKEARVPTADEIAEQKRYERLVNGGFEHVERLVGNVGYIKFNGFFSPEAAAGPLRSAMDFVSNTDALIFDIRQNGGGHPATVRLVCSYLFGDTPVHLNDIYFRPSNKTEEFWTLKKVAGKRYLNKEVYLLTGKHTGSGAEEFAYDLKNLRRATIVGESTWGGANPGGVVRLDDHFSAFIPKGRAINPYTKTNWEGVGVDPDVHVPAEDALRTAHVLAIKKLLARAATPDEKERLGEALKAAESGQRQ